MTVGQLFPWIDNFNSNPQISYSLPVTSLNWYWKAWAAVRASKKEKGEPMSGGWCIKVNGQ